MNQKGFTSVLLIIAIAVVITVIAGMILVSNSLTKHPPLWITPVDQSKPPYPPDLNSTDSARQAIEKTSASDIEPIFGIVNHQSGSYNQVLIYNNMGSDEALSLNIPSSWYYQFFFTNPNKANMYISSSPISNFVDSSPAISLQISNEDPAENLIKQYKGTYYYKDFINNQVTFNGIVAHEINVTALPGYDVTNYLKVLYLNHNNIYYVLSSRDRNSPIGMISQQFSLIKNSLKFTAYH